MTNYYKKGITALELLLVVAVLGAVFSIVIPQFSKIRELQALKSGVADILSSIDKARSQTLSSLNSLEYGVHFETAQIIIFQGVNFSTDDINNEIINVISPAGISNVTFDSISDVSGKIYFNRLSGNPNRTGTVTLSTANFSKIITISATGVASVN